ncbi:MAG TPA: hypothetical protein VJR05_07275 [Acidimicrobiia bacterium]|nr:hypothetical protein [Acidimicrobiia bacterium]
MNWSLGAVVALVVILVVVLVVLVRLRHPEKLKGEGEAAPQTNTAPAEPGAEGMNPEEAGEPSTGPGEDRFP